MKSNLQGRQRLGCIHSRIVVELMIERTKLLLHLGCAGAFFLQLNSTPIFQYMRIDERFPFRGRIV